MSVFTDSRYMAADSYAMPSLESSCISQSWMSQVVSIYLLASPCIGTCKLSDIGRWLHESGSMVARHVSIDVERQYMHIGQAWYPRLDMKDAVIGVVRRVSASRPLQEICMYVCMYAGI